MLSFSLAIFWVTLHLGGLPSGVHAPLCPTRSDRKMTTIQLSPSSQSLLQPTGFYGQTLLLSKICKSLPVIGLQEFGCGWEWCRVQALGSSGKHTKSISRILTDGKASRFKQLLGLKSKLSLLPVMKWAESGGASSIQMASCWLG